jgi:hypothetical protein
MTARKTTRERRREQSVRKRGVELEGDGKTLDGVLKTARTTAKRASKRAMRIRACDTAVCTCSCGKHMFRASHEIR